MNEYIYPDALPPAAGTLNLWHYNAEHLGASGNLEGCYDLATWAHYVDSCRGHELDGYDSGSGHGAGHYALTRGLVNGADPFLFRQYLISAHGEPYASYRLIDFDPRARFESLVMPDHSTFGTAMLVQFVNGAALDVTNNLYADPQVEEALIRQIFPNWDFGTISYYNEAQPGYPTDAYVPCQNNTNPTW